MNFRMIVILLAISLLSGCSRMVRLGNVNMADHYNPSGLVVNPVYHISHVDMDYSRLHIAIPTGELLYTSDEKIDFFVSRFDIDIKIYDGFDKNTALLSSQYNFKDTLFKDDRLLTQRTISFPLTMGKDYWVYIQFRDLNGRNKQTTLFPLEKSGYFGPAFFSINNLPGKNPFVYPYQIDPGFALELMHWQKKEFEMEVNRFPVSEIFPAAPYVVPDTSDVVQPLLPDTTFRIVFSNARARLRLPGNGFYHFSKPTDLSDGFSISSFWGNFPRLPIGETFLYPLRYLTSSNEFKALLALGDSRMASLRFWSKIAGNPDRGEALMERYNTRVIQANQRFSSHLPGWQTDRGMIYIIYGPPELVFIQSHHQTWYYSEDLNSPAAEFVFTKIKHTLTDNHFVLERSPSYRRSWNYAVDKWRR